MKEDYFIISGYVDEHMVENILYIVKEKISDDCKKLHIAVQSSGGSVPIALAIADLLMSLPCEVITYNIGNVDSAALLIYSAGEDRVCSPGARFFIHPIGKEIKGVQTVKTLIRYLKEINQDTERVANYLARQTKTNTAKWKEMYTKNYTLLPEQAVKLGVVYRIEEFPFKINISK